MNTTQSERYRHELFKLFNQVRINVQSVEEQTCRPTGGQTDGGLSNVPMHLADIGTDVNQQETNGVLLGHERHLSGEVQAALDRLEVGTYGLCETCHKPISEARLNAVPYARKCIGCASKEDQSATSDLDSFQQDRDSESFPVPQRMRRKARDQRGSAAFTDFENETEGQIQDGDIHAAGTAGGGTAVGGLAGTNIGRGDPGGDDLERATSSGEFDAEDRIDTKDAIAFSGASGGAVGGTPAGKREAGVVKSSRDEQLGERRRTRPRRRKS